MLSMRQPVSIGFVHERIGPSSNGKRRRVEKIVFRQGFVEVRYTHEIGGGGLIQTLRSSKLYQVF